jgi:hypothetical protein
VLARYYGIACVIAPVIVTTLVLAVKPYRPPETYYGTIHIHTLDHRGPFEHQFIMVATFPRDLVVMPVRYHGIWPSDEACEGAEVAVSGEFRVPYFEAESISNAYGGSKYDPCRRYRCIHPNPCDDRGDMRFQ